MSEEWPPVEIEAQFPGHASVLLNHAHRGFACGACEILRLRKALQAAREVVRHYRGVSADSVSKGSDVRPKPAEEME